MEASSKPFDIRRVGPAIDIAMEDAARTLNMTFEVIKRPYSGDCPYEPPVGLLSMLYHQEGIDAVLGPACSQGIPAAARLAQYLKLPMVTGLGDLVIRKTDVDMFKTLTILSYNLQKLSGTYCIVMIC
ncbi:hypothetical protein DPMN_010467 [Dreissena polymorpha]|uniref:Receptor ligand binding region domain-containing protein n=1 Tax=Dreissena polymorpha TaxID=45954 RepID=A0A9D4MYU4_DREPO|nr:hypothetical protein DPMN_010467 [Dreissena polymorpha]